MPGPESTLPRVTEVATRRDWLAVAGVWAALALISATSFLGRSSTPPPWWLVLPGFLFDSLVWLGLTPALFALLDRLPFEPGRRIASLAGYLVVAFAAGAVHALIAQPVLAMVARSFGRVDPVLSWWPFIWGDFTNAWVGVAAHVVLQRGHRDRLREARAARLEVLLARAKLAALAHQLEPHFLFNTLNGIASLIRSDPSTAEAMIVRLSDLLRATLGGGDRGELALGEELERLELYLSIQRMRLGPRLRVTQRIAPETLGARVPTLLLQPLVENAVIHGVGAKPGPAEIEIGSRVIGGDLEVTVRDNGLGITSETREGTGIGNTRARLAVMFPGRHRLTIAPVAGGGTAVTVVMPLESPRGVTGTHPTEPAQ